MFKRLLEKWCCLHQWKIIGETEVLVKGNSVPMSMTKVLMCEKCGKIERVDL